MLFFSSMPSLIYHIHSQHLPISHSFLPNQIFHFLLSFLPIHCHLLMIFVVLPFHPLILCSFALNSELLITRSYILRLFFLIFAILFFRSQSDFYLENAALFVAEIENPQNQTY